MAVHNYNRLLSFKASGDLSALQNHFVKPDTDGKMEICGDGENAIGVQVNAPEAEDEQCDVMCEQGSLVEVVAGGVVTAGDKVASTAAGRAATATTADEVLGIAMSTSAADGDLITLLFSKEGIIAGS
jgi:hypothetical protein